MSGGSRHRALGLFDTSTTSSVVLFCFPPRMECNTYLTLSARKLQAFTSSRASSSSTSREARSEFIARDSRPSGLTRCAVSGGATSCLHRTRTVTHAHRTPKPPVNIDHLRDRRVGSHAVIRERAMATSTSPTSLATATSARRRMREAGTINVANATRKFRENFGARGLEERKN